ncbi:MAG: DUF4403 family protein [Gemmatimonas sp.]
MGSIWLSGCGSDALSPAAPTAAVLASGPVARKVLPPISPSVVDAPISYALEPMLVALEQSVPRSFGNLTKRITMPSNKRQSFAFAATRTPFSVDFDGTRLTLSTVVSYAGRGWYDPMIGPTVSASCGLDSIKPRVRVVMTTDLEVNSEWQILAKSRVRSLKPVTDTDRDACRVTLFNIDVTDRVVAALGPQLQSRLPAVDRRIRAFDLRRRVERWYNLLNKSIRIQDSLWLVLAPEQVRLGGLRLEDTALVADVRLFARPLLVYGPAPARITTTLPALVPADRVVGDSAHLLLEGLLGYDAASTLLSKQLVGRKFSRFGRKIEVARARFYPLGDGRVVLALGISGAVSGDAYFVGTPQIDTASRMLAVPDLDFDVATANALVRGLAWMKKGDMVTELRARARVPIDSMLEETRVRVEEALNRDLADGVTLSGTVTTGRLLDVVAEPRWLVVRAEAFGKLGLGIDREIKLKKGKKKSVTDTAAPGRVPK